MNERERAPSKLAWIKDRLAEGMTVYVTTHTRSTRVTPKDAQSWVDDGRELFKLGHNGTLLMARGKRYDCIDYCGLGATD